MACNCTTNAQLEELYKRFGQKKKVSKGATLSFKIKNKIEDIAEILILSIATPLFIVYVAFNRIFGDNKISFVDFFQLKEENNDIRAYYERQQKLQNKN